MRALQGVESTTDHDELFETTRGVRKCRGACVPWCVCAVVRVCRGACVPWCACAVVRVCRGACVPWCVCAVVRVCRGAVVRVCRGAVVRVCRDFHVHLVDNGLRSLPTTQLWVLCARTTPLRSRPQRRSWKILLTTS